LREIVLRAGLDAFGFRLDRFGLGPDASRLDLGSCRDRLDLALRLTEGFCGSCLRFLGNRERGHLCFASRCLGFGRCCFPDPVGLGQRARLCSFGSGDGSLACRGGFLFRSSNDLGSFIASLTEDLLGFRPGPIRCG
jgi:hypothetical protein